MKHLFDENATENLFEYLGDIFRPDQNKDFNMYPISKNRDEFECTYNGMTYCIQAHSDFGDPVIDLVSIEDRWGEDHETDNYPERLIEEWLTDFYFEPEPLDIDGLTENFGRHFN